MKTAIFFLSVIVVVTSPNAHAVLHGEATSLYAGVVKLEASGYVRNEGAIRPDSFLCSGSKISANLILTSAHCLCDLVVKRGDPLLRTFFKIPSDDSQYYLKINDQKLTDAEIGFFPGAYGTHCGRGLFSSVLSVGYYNDLALIKVAKADLAKLPAETIEVETQSINVGDRVEIVGYGTTQVTLSSTSGKQPAYDVYGTRMIGRNTIQAIGRDTIDVSGRLLGKNAKLMIEEATVLPGDSGGPLLKNGKLIGVASGQAWTHLDQAPKKIVNESGYASSLSQYFKDSIRSALSAAE
jgi:hypothetical protein